MAEGICPIPGCERLLHGHVERFWTKVDKNGPIPEYRPGLGPCWLWIATRYNNGYGRFALDHQRNALAHRVAYVLLFGPFPEGLELDHLCRVRHCVKAVADQHGPAHLEPVTHRENLLRGNGVGRFHAAKTHCPKGHPYSGSNLFYDADGGRRCRACLHQRNIDAYRRKHPASIGRSITRTHCPAGHPYDEANTYVDPKGYRHCRTCKNDRRRKR